jgi:hypothetical protein
MMAFLNAQGTCVCGSPYRTKIKKPTRFQFTTTKFSCRRCGSRFLISCLIDKSSILERKFTNHVDIMHLSKKAQKIVGDKIMERQNAS